VLPPNGDPCSWLSSCLHGTRPTSFV
jgi:hypothetical protein